MSQDSQMRARVLGKQRKALRVSWTLDVRGQAFRCIIGPVTASGQTYQLEVRTTKGWQSRQNFAASPSKLLLALASGMVRHDDDTLSAIESTPGLVDG